MTEPMPQGKLLAVAPMMAWTNAHCRYLHRLFSPNALLFTEMLHAGAILHGRRSPLRLHSAEQPVACQIGGNDPEQLARAAAAAARAGFAEVNLNVGCPSPKVQRGCFGAALMASPGLVAQCLRAMRKACGAPVTVKCRLGIDDQDTDENLHAFVAAVADAGCRRVYVHARKAVLAGLNPAQNRSIPPLQPQRVYALKRRFPELAIIANGGISSLPQARVHLQHTDGLMIGRAAWHEPRFLAGLDALMFGGQPIAELDAANAYLRYMAERLDAGVELADLVRPMLGLFKGMPGARRYRQLMSCPKALRSQGMALVWEALGALAPTPKPQAAAA